MPTVPSCPTIPMSKAPATARPLGQIAGESVSVHSLRPSSSGEPSLEEQTPSTDTCLAYLDDGSAYCLLLELRQPGYDARYRSRSEVHVHRPIRTEFSKLGQDSPVN